MPDPTPSSVTAASGAAGGRPVCPPAIAEIAARCEGTVRFAARDLTTGAVIGLRVDGLCATASVIKLPILAHAVLLAHEGALSLDDTVTLTEADKVPGSGILTQLSAGLTLSLRDACTLMIALSDNTATNLVLDRVCVAGVNARLRDLGYARTRLFRKVYSPGPPVCEENRKYGLGVSTPREMLRLLTDIHAGRVGGPDACAEIRAFLARQQDRNGIPRLLPADCSFEGKSGAVNAARNDAGIVTTPDGRAIAMAIFCQQMPRPLWTADSPGLLTIAQISRAVVEHFAA